MLGVEPVALKLHPQPVAAKSKPGQLFDLLMPLLIQPQVGRHCVWLFGLKPSKVGEVLPAYPLWQLGAADQPLGPIHASYHALFPSKPIISSQRSSQHCVAATKGNALGDLPSPASPILSPVNSLPNGPKSTSQYCGPAISAVPTIRHRVDCQQGISLGHISHK